MKKWMIKLGVSLVALIASCAAIYWISLPLGVVGVLTTLMYLFGSELQNTQMMLVRTEDAWQWVSRQYGLTLEKYRGVRAPGKTEQTRFRLHGAVNGVAVDISGCTKESWTRYVVRIHPPMELGLEVVCGTTPTLGYTLIDGVGDESFDPIFRLSGDQPEMVCAVINADVRGCLHALNARTPNIRLTAYELSCEVSEMIDSGRQLGEVLSCVLDAAIAVRKANNLLAHERTAVPAQAVAEVWSS